MPEAGRAPSPPVPVDEGRHPLDLGERDGAESWWFDAWTPDGALAVTCRITLVPAAGRAWYWCHLVRLGAPLLQVVDLDVPLMRTGLTVRSAGVWADHVCEAPFEQWTVANEATAVALDEPEDALGRAYGEATPIAVDLEWYAAGPVEPVVAAATGTVTGYQQEGEVHGVVELRDGPLSLQGRGARGHVWGALGAVVAADAFGAPPTGPVSGLSAPVALPGGTIIDQVAGPDGWRRWVRPRAG